MNTKGIGVALLGNLENHPPLPEQLASLYGLLVGLCRRFNIQPGRVLGHCEVKGAATACPSRRLDMDGVRRDLAARLAGCPLGAAPAGGQDIPAPPPGPEGRCQLHPEDPRAPQTPGL